MLKYFRKNKTTKPKDFKFNEPGYLLTSETLKECDYIKKIFFISINILIEEKYKGDGVEDIKKLVLWYEKSDTLLTSLINEMFTSRFIDTIDKRYALFEVLDKIFKMFYLFDMYRLKSTSVFHEFTNYKFKNRKKINDREIIKLSTFCSVAMPMGRLFLTYFTMEKYEMFHPAILKKRTTLFLNDVRKDYLKYICGILVDHTKFKYLKIYFCALYEKLTKDTSYDKFFETLSKKEKNYYIDMINLL